MDNFQYSQFKYFELTNVPFVMIFFINGSTKTNFLKDLCITFNRTLKVYFFILHIHAISSNRLLTEFIVCQVALLSLCLLQIHLNHDKLSWIKFIIFEILINLSAFCSTVIHKTLWCILNCVHIIVSFRFSAINF